MKEMTYQDMILNQLPVPHLLLQSYTKLGLNEHDLVVLLVIHHFIHRGKEFPQPVEIASYLTITEDECVQILRKLLDKKVLEIKELQTTNGKLSEAFSLEPLWQQIFAAQETEHAQEGKIFSLFEQEFGRPLSPFEIETINVWLDEDKMKPALIQAALREAVLMGKLNFKYIDRILREWKRKGIKTVEQVKQNAERVRREPIQKTYEVEKRDTSVYYNWLEGGK